MWSFLVVADLHGHSMAQKHLLSLLERRKHGGLILIGDITQLGPLDAIRELFKHTSKFSIPILSVPGNCDPKETPEVLEELGVSLHKKCVKIGEITFIGLGGSNVTPFNTPLEYTETEIQEELNSLSSLTENDFILVTHVPPFGTQADLLPNGTHVGSKSVKKFIEKMQPLLNLCGHVHEARSVSQVGRTIIVNPGPLSQGYAAEFLTDGKEARVELIKV